MRLNQIASTANLMTAHTSMTHSCVRRLSLVHRAFSIFLASWLVAGTLHTVAAPDPTREFAIESWMTEHGLPQSSITSMIQTRAGYIWLGTYHGIAQFDGVRFTVFDSSTTTNLPNSRIASLYEDANGDIWIG